jgi:predicted HAD superfamily phosphohydrolase YqeG
MKLYTILVEPISRKEFPGTKIMRLLEKTVVNRRLG